MVLELGIRGDDAGCEIAGGMDVRGLRLRHHHIANPHLESPADLVQWMGAVQAQDYAQAAWALALRVPLAVSSDIDRALDEGSILRTHVLRPTWHFVSPADIRWMLALTGPRVKAGAAHRYRNLHLSEADLARSSEVLKAALQGGRFSTREELGLILDDAGIETRTPTPQRLVHIIMSAELDGIICSGPRRGKQFTYALMDERAPQGPAMSREDSVVELVRRYFTSHGPATVQDFVWWSGLTVADARMGLEALKGEITGQTIENRTYWLPREDSTQPPPRASVHLLPAYDEYTVAYVDRRDILRPENSPQPSTVMLGPVIVADGFVVGTWKRTLKRAGVVIDLVPFTELSEAERWGAATAAGRFGHFLDMPVVVI